MNPAGDRHQDGPATGSLPDWVNRRRITPGNSVCIKVTVSEIEGGKETILSARWNHVQVGPHRREAEQKADAVADAALAQLTSQWRDQYPHRD
jgi:hypothetical protein